VPDEPKAPDDDPDLRSRKKVYFWLMGVCIGLILLAWNVVRLWSVPAAVVMSAIAAVIPPTAAILGNRRSGA
jgi:hypothetical protein